MRIINLLALSLLLCCWCGSEDHSYYVSPDPEPPPDVDLWPRWCPADTAAIAYTHVAQTLEELRQLGTYSIWVVDVPSGAKRFVASGVAHDWTPDGRSILFCRDGGLWTIDIGTAAAARLLSSTFCGGPRFSPDGTRVSLTKGTRPDAGTWIASLNPVEERWISRRFASDWSPDGSRLICDSLVIIAPDGIRIGTVPHSSAIGYASDASWSPNGASLAVTGRGPAIYVVRIDGSGEKVVVKPGAVPSWSPDGSKIAYGAISEDRKGMVIWTVSKDGTEKHQLTYP